MKDSEPQDARALKGARARLLLDAVTWCYFGAAAVFALHLWPTGDRTLATWGIALSVPSAAALLFVVVGLIVPSILGAGRLSFPLTLTLPSVYAALMVMCVTLSTRVGSAIILAPEPIRNLGAFANWPVLAQCLLIDMALLTFAARRGPRSGQPGATVDSG